MSTLITGPPCAPASVRPANQLAMQITGRSYLSHSQLSLLRSCPRKFAFVYLEKARPDFVPSSLLFGGAIHAALEMYFRARLEGLEITHSALLSGFWDAWKTNQSKNGDDLPVRYNQGEDIDTIHALADRMLLAFMDSPLATPKGTIIGVEEELTISLDPALPDLLSKVDLVTQTDGALHLVDWKTSRSRWNQEKAAASADQLVLYGVTASRMSEYLHLPVKLTFAIITKAKKSPQVQLFPIATDAARVQLLKENVHSLWSAMQSGNFYPAPSPQHCTTCPFKSRCPVFAGR